MRLSISSASLILLLLATPSEAWLPASSATTSAFSLQRSTFSPTAGARATEAERRKRDSLASLLLGRQRSTALFDSPTDALVPQLQFYNSLSRTKESFVKPKEEKVSMYTCGPTVYDYAHLGNFRAFLTYDVWKRVLAYFGYTVEHVCNLTDVDDKIIQRANEQKLKDVSELTRKYESLFLQDLAKLNAIPADHYPRATEHIPEMMDLIQRLADQDLAYELKDGSWYFRSQAQEGYGTKLVQLNYDDMQATDDTGGEKEHFADFCLWKAYKEGIDRPDSSWKSATMKLGRPGWHLECSAMSRKFFPHTLDFHGGGCDLKFPHHENEIAQSEGAYQEPFCDCWFHNGFVNLENDEKMSKSLGNFLTLAAACPTALDVRAYRYLIVSSQYRAALTFSTGSIKASKNALKRMDKVVAQLPEITNTEWSRDDLEPVARKALDNFEIAIADDLSMPRATASLFGLVKAAEKELKQAEPNQSVLLSIRQVIDRMDTVFGIFYSVPMGEGDEEASVAVPSEVMDLVSQRSEAKEAKDWELADSLRNRITELGFAVKDVKGGDPVVTAIDT